MLSDDDLERALQRYRVVDPPSGFELAIVGVALSAPRRFEWLWGPAAAAAVLAIWFSIQLSLTKSQGNPIRDEAVASVTEMLGGGENAAAYAEFVVPQPPKQDASLPLEDGWREN
jgi:hypothetical protein